jgi:hypothetical protein
MTWTEDNGHQVQRRSAAGGDGGMAETLPPLVDARGQAHRGTIVAVDGIDREIHGGVPGSRQSTRAAVIGSVLSLALAVVFLAFFQVTKRVPVLSAANASAN